MVKRTKSRESAQSDGGFTLIELMIVMAIIAVLATIAELVFAFRAFRWWGFLIAYGFFGLPDFIFRHRNPAPLFYLGLGSTSIATVLIVWR